MDMAAAAHGPHGAVLGHFKGQCCHRRGTSWITIASICAAWRKVLPGLPFCPPVGRWPATRKDLGAGLFKPSLEGGLLELRLFMFRRARSCSKPSCKASA